MSKIAVVYWSGTENTEELEESEFEPMFEAYKPNLTDKQIALFGSYG